ncbi:MAG: hypothetical protein AB7E72_07445 [Lysobacterales bacterium]
MNVNLDKLGALAELFAALNAGRHLNRLHDMALWSELERERDAYELLFARLGFDLRIDDRGFAWFHFDDSSSAMSKATRHLALLLLLIFEHQADAGRHLGRFADWRIDRALLTELIEKHQLLLEAEALADPELLAVIMRSAVNYGFAEAEGQAWRLLPSVYRYLDRFEALARDDDSSANEGDVSAEGELP